MDLSPLGTDLLSFEEAYSYAKDLDFHPVSQTLGLWPLTNSNDSNPYCFCLGSALKGVVLYLSHDGTTCVSHSSLEIFLSSVALLMDSGAELIDECKAEFPMSEDVMARADSLLPEIEDPEDDNESVVLAVLSACSPAAITECLSSGSMWIREEAAILVGRHVYTPAREALMVLAEAGDQQDNRAAKASLSAINRKFFAHRS